MAIDFSFIENAAPQQTPAPEPATEHIPEPNLSTYPECVVSQPDAETIRITVKGVTFNMKLVEGGMMDGNIELSDFYLGETVVTQELWQMIMGDNPSKDNRDMQLPVTNFSAAMCNVFIRKLEKLTGCDFSIPTFLQWQYAHDGGKKSVRKTKYAGSDNVDEVAWTNENSGGKLQAVALLEPNELELFDMDGNVMECCIGEEVKVSSYSFNPISEQVVKPIGDIYVGIKKLDKKQNPITAGSTIIGLRLAINVPVAESTLSKVLNGATPEYIFTNKTAWDSPLMPILLRQQKQQEPRLLSEAEKRLARMKLTHTLTITAVQDPLVAQMALRIILGWATTDSRQKLANIPVEALVTEDKDKAKKVFKLLSDSGIDIDINTINGLGELVAWDEEKEKTESSKNKKQASESRVDLDVNTITGMKNAGAKDGVTVDAVLAKHENRIMLFNRKGELLNKKAYQYVKDEELLVFQEELAKVISDDGYYGFIDKDGKEVIPCKYENTGDFHEGLAWVSDNRFVGFIDKLGKEVIPFEAGFFGRPNDNYGVFSEGRAWFKKSPVMCIDRSGRQAFDFITYDNEAVSCIACRPYSEGLAAVRTYSISGKKWGFVNLSGELVILPKYENAFGFHEGRARVKENGKWGFIDTDGEEVVSPDEYEEAYSFREGRALVKENGKWGFIDTDGDEVVSPDEYEDAFGFREGRARVKENGKWGFVDIDGDEVIPCKYMKTGDFHEGMAWVKKNDNKCGFIDKSGKEIISCKYDAAADFCEDLAPVGKEGKWGVIDKSGKEVIPCKYDFVRVGGNNLIALGNGSFMDFF